MTNRTIAENIKSFRLNWVKPELKDIWFVAKRITSPIWYMPVMIIAMVVMVVISIPSEIKDWFVDIKRDVITAISYIIYVRQYYFTKQK